MRYIGSGDFYLHLIGYINPLDYVPQNESEIEAKAQAFYKDLIATLPGTSELLEEQPAYERELELGSRQLLTRLMNAGLEDPAKREIITRDLKHLDDTLRRLRSEAKGRFINQEIEAPRSQEIELMNNYLENFKEYLPQEESGTVFKADERKKTAPPIGAKPKVEAPQGIVGRLRNAVLGAPAPAKEVSKTAEEFVKHAESKLPMSEYQLQRYVKDLEYELQAFYEAEKLQPAGSESLIDRDKFMLEIKVQKYISELRKSVLSSDKKKQELKAKMEESFKKFCERLEKDAKIPIEFEKSGLKEAYKPFLEKNIDKFIKIDNLDQLIEKCEYRRKKYEEIANGKFLSLEDRDKILRKIESNKSKIEAYKKIKNQLTDEINTELKELYGKIVKSPVDAELYVACEQLGVSIAEVKAQETEASNIEAVKGLFQSAMDTVRNNFPSKEQFNKYAPLVAAGALGGLAYGGVPGMLAGAVAVPYLESKELLRPLVAGVVLGYLGKQIGGPFGVGDLAAGVGFAAPFVYKGIKVGIERLGRTITIAKWGEIHAKFMESADPTKPTYFVTDEKKKNMSSAFNGDLQADMIANFYIQQLFELEVVLGVMTEAEIKGPEGIKIEKLRNDLADNLKVMGGEGSPTREKLKETFEKDVTKVLKKRYLETASFSGENIAIHKMRFDVEDKRQALIKKSETSPLSKEEKELLAQLEQKSHDIQRGLEARDKELQGVRKELGDLKDLGELLKMEENDILRNKVNTNKYAKLTRSPINHKFKDVVTILIEGGKEAFVYNYFDEKYFKASFFAKAKRTEVMAKFKDFEGKTFWHLLCDKPDGKKILKTIFELQEQGQHAIIPWKLHHYFDPTVESNGKNVIHYAVDEKNHDFLRLFLKNMHNASYSRTDIKKTFDFMLKEEPNARAFYDALSSGIHQRDAKERSGITRAFSGTGSKMPLEIYSAMSMHVALGHPIPTEVEDIKAFLISLKTKYGDPTDANSSFHVEVMANLTGLEDDAKLEKFAKEIAIHIHKHRALDIYLEHRPKVEGRDFTGEYGKHFKTEALSYEESRMLVALFQGDADMFTYLADKNRNFAKKNFEIGGKSVNLLHIAAEVGHPKIVAKLHKMGVPVNDAFIAAAKAGKTEVVREFLEIYKNHSPAFLSKNINGENPVTAALENNHQETFAVLYHHLAAMKPGTKVNEIEKNIETIFKAKEKEGFNFQRWVQGRIKDNPDPKNPRVFDSLKRLNGLMYKKSSVNKIIDNFAPVQVKKGFFSRMFSGIASLFRSAEKPPEPVAPLRTSTAEVIPDLPVVAPVPVNAVSPAVNEPSAARESLAKAEPAGPPVDVAPAAPEWQAQAESPSPSVGVAPVAPELQANAEPASPPVGAEMTEAEVVAEDKQPSIKGLPPARPKVVRHSVSVETISVTVEKRAGRTTEELDKAFKAELEDAAQETYEDFPEVEQHLLQFIDNDYSELNLMRKGFEQEALKLGYMTQKLDEIKEYLVDPQGNIEILGKEYRHNDIPEKKHVALMEIEEFIKFCEMRLGESQMTLDEIIENADVENTVRKEDCVNSFMSVISEELNELKEGLEAIKNPLVAEEAADKKYKPN